MKHCDFCFLEDPTWVVPCEPFTMPHPVKPELTVVSRDDEWAACTACALMIKNNRWPLLVRRAMKSQESRLPSRSAAEKRARKYSMEETYRILRTKITGKPFQKEV
jgi:hypothetical protein